ncbi:glycosyltransferase family protein [Aquimarina agarilytica]|uniref:glycosyl transferase family 1 n=1 Tax=Aquimarina agarilytica TaxID=1087449 RepID=UPI0002887062|nr:glycosyl transferase family 1 [Aquimarina agarilytica]
MKKVLLISYYWPPAGGPGVQRWLKFVTYLKDFGVEPIVYVPENPTYPIVDKELLNELPNGIEILKHQIFEPYALASKIGGKSSDTISKGIIPPEKNQRCIQKVLLWVRGNLFIPDARKYWVNPSVKFLAKVIEKKEINTIITTGPPHSMHLIGSILKERLNIEWIADFRDPWTSIGYHKKLLLTKWAQKKHIDLEQLVLNSADKIIVTSEGTKREFTQKTTQPIYVVTNGFEPLQLHDIVLDTKFSMAHIGSLLSERNPKNLWKAIAELIQENKIFEANFELKLAGVVSETILSTLKAIGLEKYTRILGYVSHNEAQLMQRQSQVLLLIEIDSEETKMIIPGKLFEYLQSNRPILGIGRKGADFSTILKETNTGVFYEYHEIEAIKKQLMSYFELYLKGNLSVIPKHIENYTRKSLTGKLAAIIKK